MRPSHRERCGCPEFPAKTSVLCAGGFVDRTNGTPHRSRRSVQSVSPGGLVPAVRGLPTARQRLHTRRGRPGEAHVVLKLRERFASDETKT